MSAGYVSSKEQILPQSSRKTLSKVFGNTVSQSSSIFACLDAVDDFKEHPEDREAAKRRTEGALIVKLQLLVYGHGPKGLCC